MVKEAESRYGIVLIARVKDFPPRGSFTRFAGQCCHLF
jgi:hypothetical protein